MRPSETLKLWEPVHAVSLPRCALGRVRCWPAPRAAVFSWRSASRKQPKRNVMARSMPVKRKKRGRPATGVVPLYGVRIPDNLMLAVDRWGQENDSMSRSDAIRRLIELGLSFGSKPPKIKN